MPSFVSCAGICFATWRRFPIHFVFYEKQSNKWNPFKYETETEIDLFSNNIKLQLQLYIRLYTVNNTTH